MPSSRRSARSPGSLAAWVWGWRSARRWWKCTGAISKRKAWAGTKGRRSAFNCRWPRLPARPKRPLPPRPAACACAPLHILLVEDHGVTAKMMRMVLTAEGHTVETAGDVATALELAGQHIRSADERSRTTRTAAATT